jgi:hypothetical protein
MRIAKVQQGARQVVMSFGERNPKAERKLVGREGAVKFVQIHQGIGKLQPSAGIDWVDCQSPLRARRCLAKFPMVRVVHAFHTHASSANGKGLTTLAVRFGDETDSIVSMIALPFQVRGQSCPTSRSPICSKFAVRQLSGDNTIAGDDDKGRAPKSPC